ncbi:SMC family ATPase [uncultured Methanobrevibacter sp.]|uniref:SMC family ATPase n=1 Tax=uncultured Methanobrevibacter sp. TaxID=253161 RepID=UPI0026265AA1
MIFKKLRLQNFRSHINTEIDFNSGITIIVGENGAGKSSILEGISYALFKDSDVKQEDLVRTNKNSSEKIVMTVELAFEQDGDEYKVIREKKGSTNKSTLFRRTSTEERFATIASGNKNVDDEIVSIIKMNKDLFRNAIYVKQGEIANLVAKTSTERKKLITRLLNITELQNAWTEFPKILNDYNLRQSELSGKISDVDIDKQLKDKEIELHTFNENLKNALAEKEGLKEQYEKVSKDKANLDEEKHNFDLLKNNLENEKNNLTVLYDDKKNLCNQLSKILQNEKEMELLEPYVEKLTIYRSFKDVRTKYLSLESDERKLNESIEQIESNEKIIADEMENYEKYNLLEKEVKKLEDKKSEKVSELKILKSKNDAKIENEIKLKSSNDELKAFSNDVNEVLSEFDDEFLNKFDLKGTFDNNMGSDLEISSVESLDKLKDFISLFRQNIRELISDEGEKIKSLELENSKLMQEIEASREPLEEIQKVDNKCPTCQSEITPQKKEDLINSYKNTINGNDLKIMENKKRIRSINENKEILNLKYESLEDIEKKIFANKHIFSRIEELNRKISQLAAELESCKSLKEQLNQLNDSIEEKINLRKSLEENFTRYNNAQAALKILGEKDKLKDKLYPISGEKNSAYEEIKNYISKDSYLSIEIDENELNEKIKEFSSKSDKYNQLTGSIKNKKEVQEKYSAKKEEILKKEALIEEINGKIKNSEYDKEKYDQILHLENRSYEKVKNNMGIIGELNGKISQIEPSITELRNKKEQMKIYKEELKNLTDYIDLLENIRQLYSKDGIQGELRKITKPIIQSNTKAFFEKFNFNFSDLIISEDYDIFVYGPEGEANLNMVSGGEKIAIALALRLGITQALSNGNIDSILLDEPTIHLDDLRINELADLLRNMQIIPQMIIVTHDEGLESSADTLIKVKKENGISSVEIEH